MITTTIRTADDAVALVQRVAANRGHHVFLSGPVASGKTMIARRIAAALPAFVEGSREHTEHLWLMYGAGLLQLDPAWLQLYAFKAQQTRFRAGRRPFRAPHHTCSAAALTGGGLPVRPGEVSLAHGGVLFLDEAPEFRRHAMEALGSVVEQGEATVCRAAQRLTIPAAPWSLVCAAPTCPCGWLGMPSRRCTCSEELLERYQHRLASSRLMSLFAERVELEWTGPDGEAARFGSLLPV